MNFQQLGLNSAILKALEAQGYQTPTPIQSGAIPPALVGRDVLGIAQTGTGKTCAFATPILQRLAAQPQKGPRVIRSLILTPTRELALQIEDSFAAYGVNLPLRHAVIFGGVGQQPQVDKIQRGLDILVATPGRLLDLHGQGLLDLSHVEIFVLDEADRMLDMGFIHDVRRVLKLLPEKKQTLFFSATMPPEVQSLVDALLHDPAKVAVTPISSPVEVIRQSLYYVDKPNKSKLLAHLVSQPGVKNALVFSRTKHGANKIAGELVKAGISAAAIHGNKSQTARVQALTDFKAGRIKVLAATDIAARGIDIEELSHVFNYNLPDVPETYVHRIGRTGRAGHGGVAISFCDISEKDELKAIEKLLGKPIPVVEDHPWPMEDFTPPKRDKNGKIVNPEDAEARQAARERKRDRQAAEAAHQPAPVRQSAPQKPAPQAQPRAAQTPKKQADKAPKPKVQLRPAPDPRTPGQKRQAAGYKASKTLDEALTALAPKESAATVSTHVASKSERDLAFERWMAEERRIQAKQGYSAQGGGALAGDTVMDATARLLAPKGQPIHPPQRQKQPQRGRDGQPDRQPRAQKPPKAKQAPAKPVKAEAKPAKTEARPAKGEAKPVRAEGKAPAQARSAQKSAQKPAQKPIQPPRAEAKRGLFGKKAAPAQGRSADPAALEERRAKIRQQARDRRARGPVEAPKSDHQMDSTQHESLMKPYYMNED